MAFADQLNIPEWTVYVEALITFVVPLLISYVFNRFRQIEDE